MKVRPIALVGLMGAGKSAVAPLLAARLKGRAADLDARIAADAGCSIHEIFAREGEAGFRRRESTQLTALLDDPPSVLACGGGVVLDPERRERLKSACRVVWLRVSPEEAARRLDQVGETRPLLGEEAPTLA